MDNAYDMGRKRGQEESRKEIERLKKEKEWLFKNYVKELMPVFHDLRYHAKLYVIKEMHQALKGE